MLDELERLFRGKSQVWHHLAVPCAASGPLRGRCRVGFRAWSRVSGRACDRRVMIRLDAAALDGAISIASTQQGQCATAVLVVRVLRSFFWVGPRLGVVASCVWCGFRCC